MKFTIFVPGIRSMIFVIPPPSIDWRNSQFFSYDWLLYFTFFSYDWLTYFTIFFLQSIDLFPDFFSWDQLTYFTICFPWPMNAFHDYFPATNRGKEMKGYIKNDSKSCRAHKIFKKGHWVFKVAEKGCQELCPTILV